MEDTIEKLIKEAANPSLAPAMAMQIAQAALNAANALRVLEEIRVSKRENPEAAAPTTPA